MRLSLVSLLALGYVALWPTRGHACGATETVLQGLLPLPGQADVPLNSVLLATGNHFEMELRLQRISSALSERGADAGPATDAGAEPTPVPVETECLREHNRRLCLGRAELERNTEYEWLVMDPGGGTEQSDSQSFTTGERVAETTAPDIDVVVTRNDVLEFYGCGGEGHVVALRFTARGQDAPFAAHVAVAGQTSPRLL